MYISLFVKYKRLPQKKLRKSFRVAFSFVLFLLYVRVFQEVLDIHILWLHKGG